MIAQHTDRAARARLVPGWDPELLATRTAVVAGVGALGNEVAKNLALAGVGRLILCDPDRVTVSNLSRTVLFTAADLGCAKPVAAAAALRVLAPDTEVLTRVADLVSGVGLGELADAGVVLGCLDSVRARMRLLGRCALVDSALVDGGTGAWGGEVRLRLSPEEPCYGCTLSAHERGTADEPWSCAEPRAGTPAAASIVATSLVAAWMTVAALRILLGVPPEYRLLRVDGLAGRTEPVTTDRDLQCPHHRPLPGPVTPVDVSHRQTVRDLLAALPEGAEVSGWTRFPIPLRCLRCELYHPQPAAAGDGGMNCARCGALIRPQFSERLRDAEAGRSLHELGIAPKEILTVRLREGGHQWRRLR
jgi:molybdopterin-synthase adenylyltransferase